jgi:hypothetical protein
MRILLLIVLLFTMLRLRQVRLWSPSRSAGDDFGAGKLIYPQRNDFQVGDLDLLQLQISRDSQGSLKVQESRSRSR